MNTPLAHVIFIVVSVGFTAALLLGTAQKEECYLEEGEMKAGVFVAHDEPRYVCEDGGGSSRSSRSLRTGSSSKSSGSWFRK